MSILAAILVVASTSLHITVWPDGMGAEAAKKTYTLHCAPVGGTLPKRAAACAKLIRLQRPFAPVPTGMACTMIYGGPQVALVTGRLRGNQIRATFSRKDGCQLARWNRVGFLFPGASASAHSR
jgi:subtilisin inhibitor-like